MEQFKSQHQRMIDIAQMILGAARHPSVTGAERLTKLRLALSKEVSSHVAEEFREINVHHNLSTATNKATMNRYHDELLKWRRALMECNCAWPPARIFEHPESFVSSFKPIVEALVERIRWEEQELYPSLKLGSATAH